METLSYRSGEIDLQLLAPDVAALDQLRQKISEPGKFVAEIQSANPDNDVIKGRVQIMAADGS
jgi:type II secretory pathway component PulL